MSRRLHLTPVGLQGHKGCGTFFYKYRKNPLLLDLYLSRGRSFFERCNKALPYHRRVFRGNISVLYEKELLVHRRLERVHLVVGKLPKKAVGKIYRGYIISRGNRNFCLVGIENKEELLRLRLKRA